MLQKTKHVLRTILCGLFLCGAGKCDDGEIDVEDQERAAAEELCLEVAQAVRTGALRCGLDGESEYDAFLDLIGGCDEAEAIRDESMLDLCIDALEGTNASTTALSCEDLTAGRLGAACQNQILRTKPKE